MTDPQRPLNIVPLRTAPLPAIAAPPAVTHGSPVARPPYERPLSAVRRHKWLVLGILAAAAVVGIVTTRLVKPQYEVRATLLIEPETPVGNTSGPIRSPAIFNASAWVELVRSYRIVDAVVRKLALYVRPEDPADLGIFSAFGIADRFLPGKYEVVIDRGRKRWHLAQVDGTLADSGRRADSVGRRAGFHWIIPASAFEGDGSHKVKFTVSTPRETAIDLMKQLSVDVPSESNFLWLRFRGQDPQLAQRTLNTWVNEYVSVASELKKRNIVEFAHILGGQLRYAESSLRDAERALENFRVHTITLPSEGAPVAPGLEMTRDPALKSFFDQKIAYDDVRHDREELEKVIAGVKAGTTPWEAVLLIPSVVTHPGAESLRDAFTELHTRQADLAAKRQIYTDQHPAIQELSSGIRALQGQTIPSLVLQLRAQLRERENQSSQRIASASREMQSIPTRTIEEMRLRRAVAVSEGLYTTLKSRSAEAGLAAASATPDVTVLDTAVAPLRPARNTAPSLLLLAILGGLVVAFALAMLLDAFDPKIRYPEQVTDELGLSIAGAIPEFPKGGVNSSSPEQTSQLIEAVRTVRMHVQNTTGVPVTVAISSPSPSDGKSFVATNLAMSFSDAGFRTVLVDADTRRGALHEMFDVPIEPGLTEYLAGSAGLDAVIRPTHHNRLFLIPRGRKQRSSPELLTSAQLPALAAEARERYDVVIFDTPPLAAGIDAFAVATAAQNVLIVLRLGATERRMAAAKMELVDRIPVHVLGAVLNCVQFRGEFEYYRYSEGYGTDDAESTALIR